MSFDFSCSADILLYGQFAKRKEWLHAAGSEIKGAAATTASATASAHCLWLGVRENSSEMCVEEVIGRG